MREGASGRMLGIMQNEDVPVYIGDRKSEMPRRHIR
jgi:hypothetical protein